MRVSNEIKAGLVILTALAVGALFFFKTTSVYTETYQIRTYFNYAGNLKPNAVIKLAGIEVGRLKEMDFEYAKNRTSVKCVLEIDSNARVREDSLAYIGTAGFVGDAYIGLTAGTSHKFIEPGGMVKSEDPVQMRKIMKKADNIANNLDSILKDVKEVVSGNRDELDNIVSNLEMTTENFKDFSEDVKKHPWKLLFKGE